MLKGLIFDLDGTITLTQAYHQQAFAEIFKKFGIIYTAEEDLRTYAGNPSDNTIRTVLKNHHIQITAEEVQKLCDERRKTYAGIIKNAKIEVVPGIREFLTAMKEKGHKMAVASGNGTENIEFILQQIDLRNFFDALVSSHEKEVKNPKPAPDIFLRAAEKLNLKPEECIVFEDAINGIQGALAAKIPCIALATGLTKEELVTGGASKVVNNYEEITDELLRKL